MGKVNAVGRRYVAGTDEPLQHVLIAFMGIDFLEQAWVGYARPCFGAIPPLAEMQARLFAMVCSGEPPPSFMHSVLRVGCVPCSMVCRECAQYFHAL